MQAFGTDLTVAALVQVDKTFRNSGAEPPRELTYNVVKCVRHGSSL